MLRGDTLTLANLTSPSKFRGAIAPIAP